MNMNCLKKLGISLGYVIGILLISLFLITLLNYFNIIGPKMMAVFKITLVLLSLFIGGYINGKKSVKDGWLEGLKLSGLTLLVFILFSLLFSVFKINAKTIIFYLIVTGITTFGSMIGINKNDATAS